MQIQRQRQLRQLLQDASATSVTGSDNFAAEATAGFGMPTRAESHHELSLLVLVHGLSPLTINGPEDGGKEERSVRAGGQHIAVTIAAVSVRQATSRPDSCVAVAVWGGETVEATEVISRRICWSAA